MAQIIPAHPEPAERAHPESVERTRPELAERVCPEQEQGHSCPFRHTMAESLSAASHFTGWQDVVLGDPLCCPYFPAAKHD